MKINKRLFEDVLFGKLKGTFILRNGEEISSNELIRNNSYYSETHPYKLHGATYTSNGLSSVCDWKSYDDIIDFITETDMKENELTIEIPDGKIVDWDESKKQNKIVLKDKQLTYEDVCRNLFNLYNKEHSYLGYDVFTTACEKFAPSKHQLECILAKNKLANVAVYLNDGWKPNCDINFNWGYFICVCNKELEINTRHNYKSNNNIIFKTKELAQQAIEILGEETVKLALEPLGV